MSTAGALSELVTFETQTISNPDAPADYGNTVSTWADSFTAPAEYIHLRGSESVMAARLQGTHTMVVRVRSSTQSRQVTAEARLRDARAGTVYNIRDVTPTADRAWIDFLVESGVAA